MAQKAPVRLNYDGSNLDGFAEFQASDYISLADGGTGASYASLAALRTGIGLQIGTNVQAFDSDLTTLSGLTHADGAFIVSTGSAYSLESGATARTSLGVGTGDTVQFTSLTLTGNLDVRGEVINTTAEVIAIDDAFVKLNTGNSEVDAGLIVETSDTNDARLFYDVSNNRWVLGENNSWDEILTQTSTDTITNKSISGSSNTITNIGNSALSNSSFTVTDGSNSTAVALGGTLTFTGGAGVDIAESSGTLTFTADLSEILTDFNERVDDRVGSMLTEGSNVSLTYDDAAGTLTVASTDTQLSTEAVQDIVGAMFGSNTETNISVTYDDSDGTIDLVADLLTEEAVEDFVNGMIVGGTNVTATYDDAAGTLTIAATDTNTQLTQEQVEDFVGGMLDGDETFITVAYDDTDGNIDFTVPVKDEDNMASDSATHLATQQSIKAYVDGLVQTEESIEDFVGGMFSSNTETYITASYDDSDGTLDLVVPVLDEDNMASDSSAHLATQQSIKAYVDGLVQTEESIEDFVGGMVTGNTETLITVTYDDSDGTMDFVVDNDLANYDNSTSGFITATLTTEQVQDIVGAMFTSNTETNIAATYEDSDGTIDLVSTDTQLTSEQVQDIVGAMFSSNTETNITATYEDGDGTIDLVADLLTEEAVEDFIAGSITAGTNVSVTYDDAAGTITIASTDTNTQLTQEQVEDYVGGMISGTQTFITVAYDDSGGDLTYVVPVLDEDNMASDSSTHLATQQSIKAYIDAQILTEDTLAEMGDVNLTSPADASLLFYDTGTSKWIDNVISGDITIADTGVATIAAGAVDNAMLANSSITVTDGSNSTATSLGGTITFSGTSNEVEVAESSGTITIGLPNNVTIAGDLTVSGTTTTVNSSTVTIDDPLVRYADNNSGNSVDFGWYGKYVQSSTTKYAGLVWDASASDKFRLWSGNQAEPTTTVNTSGTGHATGTLIANLEGNVTGVLTGSASDLAASALTGKTELNATPASDDILFIYDTSATALKKITRANLIAGLGAGSMQNFTAAADSGSSQTIEDGNTLSILGGSGIDTAASATDTVTVSLNTESVQDIVGAMFSSNTETNISVTYDDSDGTIDLVSTDTQLTSEAVQDIVGAMFSSNTETNIAVTYDDTDGTIDLVSTDTQLTSEQVQDIVGAMFSSNTETNIAVTYDDSDGTIDLVSTDTQLTTEQVQDIVGAMFTGNTETNITATYEDGDGTIDLVSSGSVTETFKTIAVSGQDNVVADTATDSLTFVAGSNITLTTDASADSVTIAATGGAANAFSTIAVSGQSNVVADATTDTLTLAAGTGMTLTTNAGTDTITFTSAAAGGGTMPFTEYDGSTDNIILSSASTGGALPVTLAGGSSDPISMTATTQTLTSYADDDDDTKIEVERTTDNDTVHIKAGGTDVITATSSGVTITNLTVSGTTTQANELKITDTLFELNADGSSLTTDAGMIVERGSTGDNAALIWDESTDSWVAGTTSTDGSSSSNLTYTEGDFKAKTQNQSDNSTKVATTAYVDTALGGVSSNSIGDADSDTKIQVEEGSDEDIIRADTAGQERFTVDNNVSMSARGGFFTHNATLHASETFTIASTEGTVAAGPLDVQGTVDVQGTLVVV